MKLMGDDTTREEFLAAFDALRERERTLLTELERLEDDAFSLATDLGDFETADSELGQFTDDLHVRAGELNDRIKDAMHALDA